MIQMDDPFLIGQLVMHDSSVIETNAGLRNNGDPPH